VNHEDDAENYNDFEGGQPELKFTEELHTEVIDGDDL
jgi:hypothetical protein